MAVTRWTRAGERAHRVIWQRPVAPSVDAYGGTTDDYETVSEEQVKIEPITAREVLLAEQAQVALTHLIRAVWTPSKREMRAGWRGIHRGRFFHVIGARNLDEANREIELLCVESPTAYGPAGAELQEDGVGVSLREDGGLSMREGT